MEKHQFFVEKEEELNKRYKINDLIKIPGYNVYSAIDLYSKRPVAIQEVSDIFKLRIEAQRAFTEIKTFKSLDHNNLTKLITFKSTTNFDQFKKFFIVSELFNYSLNQTICNSQFTFTVDNRRFIIYQILKVLKYLHSANIIVKSMNPSNLFVDSSYNIKFLFFAIEQFQKPDKIVERWYKAPEIFLLNNCLDSSADIWSVGCIFYTLITKKVLFQGNSLLEHIDSIISKIGNLTDDDLSYIDKKIVEGIIDVSPNRTEPNWNEIIPNGTKEEIELIKSMLVWKPSKRISIDDALKNPYFNGLNDPSDMETTEPIDTHEIDHLKLENLKQIIWEEIQNKK